MPLAPGSDGRSRSRALVHAHPAVLSSRSVPITNAIAGVSPWRTAIEPSNDLRRGGVLVLAGLHAHERAGDRGREARRLEEARLRGIRHDAEVHARRDEAQRGLSSSTSRLDTRKR